MTTKSSRFQHRNLPLLMLRAREAVFARFRPILNAHGVTEQQWRIIRAIDQQGPMEPRMICDVCTLLSPSLAGVLARMDDLGLIKRERFDNDQRRVLVSLTPKSRGLITRMLPVVEAKYAELERDLGLAFTDELYRTLDRVIEVLGSPAPAED